MNTEKAEIIRNIRLKGDYFQIDFHSPDAAFKAVAGQFAHIQITNMEAHIFRRPFSIYNTSEDGTLSVIYKAVGHGTRTLSSLKTGDVCDILGPQGNGFTLPDNNTYPIIIVGGYGSAATYILAKKAKVKGKLLIGARSVSDLILVEQYRDLGFEVEITTQDGSAGQKGVVTDILTPYLRKKEIMIYACGPNPMMYAVAKLAGQSCSKCEVSVDHPMCCGVGACFACVVKVNNPETGSWTYARSCKEGPVFNANDIYFEQKIWLI